MPKVYNKNHKPIPEEAVYIGRGSPYGNKFIIGAPHPQTGKPMTRNDVCNLYEEQILPLLDITELIGKDLICFCKPLRCHGDSLLKKANSKN